MSHPIPEDVRRLAERLRMAADEFESAARYGVPVPNFISVSGHKHGALHVSADEREFAAWAEYAEADVTNDHHHGADWSDFDVEVNGLPLRFSMRHKDAEVPA